MNKIFWGILISIIAVCLLLVESCTLPSPQTSNQITSSTPTPQKGQSIEIGTIFKSNEVQIKYISFAPVVTRNEAITIAKNWLNTGFNITTDNIPTEATVALYSGPLRPPNMPPTGEVVSDVQAWIIVLKGLPPMGSVGPPPDPNHPEKIYMEWEADIAIDATTGKVLYGITGGHTQRVPIQLAAFPVQNLLLDKSKTVLMGVGHIVLDNSYLRINLDTSNSPLLIWPPGYGVSAEDNGHTILSGSKPVAQVGDKIQVSGRSVLPNEDIQNLLIFPLPSDAQGPYWLVGDMIKLNDISVDPLPNNYLFNSLNQSSKVLLKSIQVNTNVKSSQQYMLPWSLPTKINIGDRIVEVSGTILNNHPQNKEIAMYAQGFDDTGNQVCWTLDAAHIVGQIGMHLEKGETGKFTLHLNFTENLRVIRIFANNYAQDPP